jgi:hypothetical protein
MAASPGGISPGAQVHRFVVGASDVLRTVRELTAMTPIEP